MHCSNLAADALHAAIEDYLKKEGRGDGSTVRKRPQRK
jgi:nitrogen fixation NifU-like protein